MPSSTNDDRCLEMTSSDLARRFGQDGDLDGEAAALAARVALAHRFLDSEETAATLSDIRSRLAGDAFTKVGAHRAGIWQDAWSDQLARFRDGGFELSSLEPKFMSANPVIRVDGRFSRAMNSRFELDFFSVFRAWFCETWLAGAPQVMEFGCGSGFNLEPIARISGARSVVGLDWSEAAVEIANRIGGHCSKAVSGRRFNFFEPDGSLAFQDGAAVVTFCALEQTGDRFAGFLEFLLSRRPDRVLHMEPIEEFYDRDNPVDASALRYHHARGYLSLYLTELRNRERMGELRIVAAKRLGFGSLYHEAYGYVVWEPV